MSSVVLHHAGGDLRLTNVHSLNRCVGSPCVIHNPTNHSMLHWPMHWRGDRGLMERTCPHGFGHPDPDSMYFFDSIGMGWMGVHGCDGCCRPESNSV